MSRANKEQIFSVVGSGEFPIDMLRYDRVTPLTANDSEKVKPTFIEAGAGTERRVSLIGKSCTPDRWKSFGWTVVD